MKTAIKFSGIELSVSDFASQGNAILGIRDSGKSYTATWFAEQLLSAGVPFIAFDPIGVWKYLKIPGKGAGFHVVVAGEGGDLPLTPEGAPEIVRAAMKENIPLVLDLYSMALSKADWKKIVEASVRLLLYENKAHGLRHVFIEEAAEFCPQRIGPDQGRVYAEIEKLARMGGNASLGYTLINQRAEEVNKAVLELCDCLFLHRQKGRNSLTALGKWLDFADAKQSREIVRELPVLQQGECWVWFGGSDQPRKAKIPEKESLHPDRRKPVTIPHGTGADVGAFVGRIKLALQSLPDGPENRTVNPQRRSGEALAGQEIAGLKEQLKASQSELASQVNRTAANRKQVEQLAEYLESTLERVKACLRTWYVDTKESKTKLDDGFGGTLARKAAEGLERERGERRDFGPNGLAFGERRVLIAVAQYDGGIRDDELAVLTGYKRTSRNEYLKKLVRKSYIERTGDRIEATPRGIEALGNYERLPVGGRALIAYWMEKLPAGEAKVLRAVIENAVVDREFISIATGYKKTSVNEYVKKLAARRLVKKIVPGGQIKLSPILNENTNTKSIHGSGH